MALGCFVNEVYIRFAKGTAQFSLTLTISANQFTNKETIHEFANLGTLNAGL